MQAIYNEDERRNSRETDSVDTIIYIRGIGRHLEEKYARRFGDRIIGI